MKLSFTPSYHSLEKNGSYRPNPIIGTIFRNSSDPETKQNQEAKKIKEEGFDVIEAEEPDEFNPCKGSNMSNLHREKRR